MVARPSKQMKEADPWGTHVSSTLITRLKTAVFNYDRNFSEPIKKQLWPIILL